jgi:hypothetical protein
MVLKKSCLGWFCLELSSERSLSNTFSISRDHAHPSKIFNGTVVNGGLSLVASALHLGVGAIFKRRMRDIYDFRMLLQSGIQRLT